MKKLKIKNIKMGQAKASVDVEVEVMKDLLQETPNKTEAGLIIKENEVGPKNIRYNSEDIRGTQS